MEYDELVKDRLDELNRRIELTQKLNDDVLLVRQLAPEGAYIWLDYEVNIDFAADSMDKIKELLSVFAKNGCLLKLFIESETNPVWIINGINSTIRLNPRWSTEEGASCRLVKIGEETQTYPKYKLVCDNKE